MPSILDKNAWAQELCKQLGNANPSANTVKFVQAWEIHESGSGPTIGCSNNPLNTCQETLGSKPCNPPHCVQMYEDFANQYVGTGGGEKEGLVATALALNNGLYPSLLHALKTNDENNLGFNGHVIAPNIASDLSVWVSGRSIPIDWGYVNAILKLAGQATLPSGGDIGQVVPVGTTTGTSQTGPYSGMVRIGIGVLGLLMMLAGATLMLKELTPAPVVKAVTRGLMK